MNKFASKERCFLSQRESWESAPNIPIRCIGWTGTGVEFRIKGHAKAGSSKIHSTHRRYVPVAMTNEFRISQTNSSHFNPILHPIQRKLVKIGRRKCRVTELQYISTPNAQGIKLELDHKIEINKEPSVSQYRDPRCSWWENVSFASTTPVTNALSNIIYPPLLIYRIQGWSPFPR
jgi:hypothetical protein